MKATVSWLGALLLAGAAVPAVHAQYGPCYYRPAPDACNQPGYYCQGPCGMWYGPNYCVRPCFEPFNGFVPPVCPRPTGQPFARPGLPMPPYFGPRPAPQGPGPLNSPVFPTHPFARSPRDYFMLEETSASVGPLLPRSPTDFVGPR